MFYIENKFCFTNDPTLSTFSQNDYYFKLDDWQSQEGPRRELCKLRGQCLSFTKVRTRQIIQYRPTATLRRPQIKQHRASKVSQSSQSMSDVLSLWHHCKGMDIKNTYAEYERQISYSKKVMANVENSV